MTEAQKLVAQFNLRAAAGWGAQRPARFAARLARGLRVEGVASIGHPMLARKIRVAVYVCGDGSRFLVGADGGGYVAASPPRDCPAD